MNNPETFMREALDEARKGWGNTHPNPMVGAVIVESGKVVARGYHAKSGQAHAEVNALVDLGRKPLTNATIYVTLEPCSSTGNTGPCTQAILESGLKKVVVGAIDPDERHRGRGIEILRENRVEVTTCVCQADCEDLNLIFNQVAQKGSPLIAGKTATTLDGKVATRNGHSKWITGELARADVMRWRRLFPATAVGAGTVMVDNPQLTSRSDVSEYCPRRIIFDRRGLTIAQWKEHRIYTDEFQGRTTLVTVDGVPDPREMADEGISIWTLPNKTGDFWNSFKKRCIEKNITGIYVEGGPGLMSDLLAHRQLDYLFAYRAPKFLSDDASPAFVSGQEVSLMANCFGLTDVRHAIFGEDQLTRGHLQYPDQ